MTYEKAIAYLETLNSFGIQLGLARIEKMLALMQHPEKKYKTIHVTGTNGKGSVTATLTSILVASGIKTAMYTSPHLSSYTERMVINGKSISEDKFAKAIFYAKAIVEQMVAEGFEHPTQFEVLTAAAFYLFACEEVEYAVIEVGLGGLLDSTNVIIPQVSVITNVSLEHTDKCGNTIREIAGHKAGIMKPGVPVVTAASGGAIEVIWEQASVLKAPLYLTGRDFSAQLLEQTVEGQKINIFTKEQGDLGVFSINLLGRHQVDNCVLAVMAALLLSKKDKRLSLHTIRQGLLAVKWPARFEIMATNHPTIIIDGAHNPAGILALRNTLDELYKDKPITFVLGILRDKKIDEMINILIKPCDQVIVVRPISERAANPAEITGRIKASYVEAAPSIESGIEKAKTIASDIICIAGSLYLAGAARDIILQRQ